MNPNRPQRPDQEEVAVKLPTRTSLGLLSLLVPLTLVPPALAQQSARPRPVLSPEVHADRQVTFRLRAPSAEEVELTGEFMDGARAMKKADDGVWSVTVGPIAPEVYEYEFTIDGATFLDPRNADVKTNQGPSGISSLLTVRGDEPLFFDVRPVPHGTVEIRTYDSGVTGLSRQVYIYTPPGYDESTEALPVLYLLHGADGEGRSWTNGTRRPACGTWGLVGQEALRRVGLRTRWNDGNPTD